jgi:hypothetical protein
VTKVRGRSYLSPTLVLLAFDWPDGAFREDFLGFAIERQPGFERAAKSWLPNRIGFQGPAPDQRDKPEGFLVEGGLWPGEDPRQMVRIHHKFIVIDAEVSDHRGAARTTLERLPAMSL